MFEYSEPRKSKISSQRWGRALANQKIRQVQILNEMRLQKDQTDVTLVCGTSKFSAHKVILSASSPYFRKRFLESTGPTEETIEITAVDENTMSLIMGFIYSVVNTCPFGDYSALMKLLKAARLFDIKPLIKVCCLSITEFISYENYSEIWQLGNACKIYALSSAAINFVIDHLPKVIDKVSFYQLGIHQLRMLGVTCVARDRGNSSVVMTDTNPACFRLNRKRSMTSPVTLTLDHTNPKTKQIGADLNNFNNSWKKYCRQSNPSKNIIKRESTETIINDAQLNAEILIDVEKSLENRNKDESICKKEIKIDLNDALKDDVFIISSLPKKRFKIPDMQLTEYLAIGYLNWVNHRQRERSTFIPLLFSVMFTRHLSKKFARLLIEKEILVFKNKVLLNRLLDVCMAPEEPYQVKMYKKPCKICGLERLLPSNQ